MPCAKNAVPISRADKVRRILVVGIGNLIMGDDGVGIHVIRALEKASFPSELEVNIVDGGLEPDLTVFIEKGINKLILVDAVQAGGAPGDIYRLTLQDVENSGYRARSSHYLNLKQSLEMLKMLGNFPDEFTVIGVEPGEMSPGMELSPAVAAKLTNVLEMVTKEIKDS